MKCGGNCDQMFREREREEVKHLSRNNTIQLFTENSTKRERNILTLKAEAPGRMTEKTDGERTEAARREAAPGPPPRSYSEFMRNLAAKYNTETTE